MNSPDKKILAALLFVAVSILIAGSLSREQWSGLVGNIATISAALIGGAYIVRQIGASDRQEKERRNAKFAAARAAMPLILSSITEYAIGCAATFETIHSSIPPSCVVPRTIGGYKGFPTFPSDTVDEFRILIEYGPNEVGRAVATLLAHIQVQRARLRDVEAWFSGGPIPTTIVTQGNIEQYILDVAEIYARTASLYDFARFRSSSPRPVIAESVVSALDQLRFSIALQPDLYDRATNWEPVFNAVF